MDWYKEDFFRFIKQKYITMTEGKIVIFFSIIYILFSITSYLSPDSVNIQPDKNIDAAVLFIISPILLFVFHIFIDHPNNFETDKNIIFRTLSIIYLLFIAVLPFDFVYGLNIINSVEQILSSIKQIFLQPLEKFHFQWLSDIEG